MILGYYTFASLQIILYMRALLKQKHRASSHCWATRIAEPMPDTISFQPLVWRLLGYPQVHSLPSVPLQRRTQTLAHLRCYAYSLNREILKLPLFCNPRHSTVARML